MEKSFSLAEELSQGQNLTKQLQTLLSHSSSPPEMRDSLLKSILSCYDRALSSIVPTAQPFDIASSGKRHDLKRKRKGEGGRTEMVRVEEEDGYRWRKYGQKRILGSKHPRGYFRCTHRTAQGCPATKLVQISDDDPSLYQVTYHGRHNCISSKLDHQVWPLSIPDDAGTTVQMGVKEHIFPSFSTPGVVADEGISLDDFNFDLDQEQTTESGVVEILSVTNSQVVLPVEDLGFDQEFPFDDLEYF